MSHLFIIAGFLAGHLSFAYFTDAEAAQTFTSTYWFLVGYGVSVFMRKLKNDRT